MGFQRSKSCEDQIFNLTTMLQHRLSDNKDTFIAFIDMAKAFDSVNRDLLFHNLLLYNIDGKMYFAIKALYRNTLNCIKLNGHSSKWFPSLFGVRQGDTLSHTLFSIFINDLIDELSRLNLGIQVGEKQISILLYVADIALVAENDTALQTMLDTLFNWCCKWHLMVNNSKSAVVHFRKSKKGCTKSKFNIGSKSVRRVSQYKYLGVILD